MKGGGGRKRRDGPAGEKADISPACGKRSASVTAVSKTCHYAVAQLHVEWQAVILVPLSRASQPASWKNTARGDKGGLFFHEARGVEKLLNAAA